MTRVGGSGYRGRVGGQESILGNVQTGSADSGFMEAGMSMSKEQQREAAKRIMEKHPLTAEDREILAYKPSPWQWAEAYEKIQESKERAKAKEKSE